MCGVVGYVTKSVTEDEILGLCTLFEESKIRGLHACGYSYLSDGVINTEKFFDVRDLVVSLKDLLERQEGKQLALVGHTRYSTSGDWKDHDNNQPLHITGPGTSEIALAFNGCIHMGRRGDYELVYGRRYTTDNDGEIFCRKVLDEESWERFIAEGRFSFAGAFITSKGFTVIRNRNRPLWMLRRFSTTYVASTADIFFRAKFSGQIEEVAPCFALRIIN